MQINDRVYGQIKITEPVIVELINSKPLQRLKGISQDGAANYIQPQRNVNRLEHSIGVWYLSSLYQRPLIEQIACLLHDVPHTAFSHVIDFVMHDEKHEFHEKFLEQIIRNSEIPSILNKYGLELEAILKKANFPLLENDLPAISVDRWDYFMRDGTMFGLMPPVLVNAYLEGIKLDQTTRQFYFTDQTLAASFAIMFMSFSRLIWLDPVSHGGFFLLANSLKRALANGEITQSDFFTTDARLLAKLKTSKDKQIKAWLKRLAPGNEFVYADKSEAEFFGPNKPRSVDPLVKVDGKLKRLSDLVPGLNSYFQDYQKNYKHLGVKAAN